MLEALARDGPTIRSVELPETASPDCQGATVRVAKFRHGCRGHHLPPFAIGAGP